MPVRVVRARKELASTREKPLGSWWKRMPQVLMGERGIDMGAEAGPRSQGGGRRRRESWERRREEVGRWEDGETGRAGACGSSPTGMSVPPGKEDAASGGRPTDWGRSFMKRKTRAAVR